MVKFSFLQQKTSEQVSDKVEGEFSLDSGNLEVKRTGLVQQPHHIVFCLSALPSLEQGSGPQAASWLDSSVNSLIQTVGAVSILTKERRVWSVQGHLHRRPTIQVGKD